MSFEAVSDQLRTLQGANTQLKALIDRLANTNFQPGSVPLNSQDDNVVTELTTDSNDRIREQDEQLELLLEEVHDLDAGRENSELAQQKDQLLSNVTRAIKDLKSYETDFRRAQLVAKRKLEAAQRAERELLLQSYIEPPRTNTSSPAGSDPAPLPRRRNQQNAALTEEEKTANAASDVTRALRKAHDMMAAELSRSQFAHETLTQSTAALAQLSETYSSLDTLIANSRNLLGTLLRSQKSDTWYLETAFYILLVTIAWLFWRRLLYGPTWAVIWLVMKFLVFPMKMFVKGWIGVFTAMGLVGGSSSESGVSGVSPSIGNVVRHQTVIHSSGTRGPRPSVRPPGVKKLKVGGGGKGAPMRNDPIPGNSRQKESVSEQVGKIIDESQGGVGDSEGFEADTQEEAEVQPNSKKRMWEQEKEAPKEAQRNKDEL